MAVTYRPLQELVRSNIWSLRPYSSARHEFDGEATVYVDANENPFPSLINRYPDPDQLELKSRIAEMKGIAPAHIFLGNGSDEAIDLVYRIFCEPARDKAMVCPPTYGMYSVSAAIHDVAIIEVSLSARYQLDLSKMREHFSDPHLKVIWLCSPNNPTGNLVRTDDIEQLLDEFTGLVVIDEAYIDFSSQPSWLNRLEDYPNLIVLQTFSKAWGAASLRLGMAFASSEIMGFFRKVKPPYNINGLTQERALRLLDTWEQMQKQKRIILDQRDQLMRSLASLSSVLAVHPSDANFILVKFVDAAALFSFLKTKGIVVRDRSSVTLCEDCLRITIGTPEENGLLLEAINHYYNQE